MRWIICSILFLSGLRAELAGVKQWDQTFINEGLLGQGIIFEIMKSSLSAVKCVDGHKVYLKSERIVPSDEGLMLVGDDASLLLLPRLYSDQYGCYVKSFMMCLSCGYQLPEGVPYCPQCKE